MHKRTAVELSPLNGNTLKPPEVIITNSSSVSTVSEDKDDVVSWIRSNIKCRQCYRFVPDDDTTSTSKDPLCACKYPKSEHSVWALDRSDIPGKWAKEPDVDITTHPTNAFGQIEFEGFGQKVADYVRVDVKTPMDTMWELMTAHWNLKPPNLVISVTGGAGFFSLTPRLREVFRKGLIKAALSTEAWITTGGTHAGVMKYVGEAVRDSSVIQGSKKIVALGIAPWGVVQQKDTLISQDGNGCWPAYHAISTPTVSKNETHLDCNHSHLILVDEGTQHCFGGEIEFRADLESSIAEKSSKRKNEEGNSAKVPIVLVVVEGGPGTLKTVVSSVEKGTPAVIIGGSGRAANILAYAYHHSQEDVIEEHDQSAVVIRRKILRISDSVEEAIVAEIRRTFGPRNIETYLDMVTRSLQHPDLLSVYEMDSRNSAKDIDIAILKALLKANQDQIVEQLKLSLVWDRVDIAKSEILLAENDKRTIKLNELPEIMFSAILWDRVDFVRLFLENGVNLKEFLTLSRLEELYRKIPSSALRSHLNFHNGEKILPQVGRFIKSIMGDFYNPLYNQQEAKYSTLMSSDNEKKKLFRRPERELFLWCILIDRCEMALIFWEEGQDSLAAALVANCILQALGDKARDNDERMQREKGAMTFHNLALGVLKSCYQENIELTQKLLARKLEFWGQVTCVGIAVQATNKEFIAQSACQALFNTIWWGKMADNDLRILPCIFCPVLSLWLKYRSVEGHSSDGRNDNLSTHRTSSRIKLSQVSPSNQDRYSAPPSRLQKLKAFFTAPVTTFSYHVLFFVAFLMLYTYIMLFSFDTDVSPGEILLIVWVGTLLSEEIRQVATVSPGKPLRRLRNYFSDKWNCLDFCNVMLFIIGMVLRFVDNPKALEAARFFLAINLFTFYMRVLHIFSVNKHMGPKLTMIGKMSVDLLSFMGIMLVFIVAYAVTSQAILYPNAALSSTVIIDVVRKAYWQVFAELFLEDIEGQNECVRDLRVYTNGTHSRCPSDTGKIVVPILLGLYMLFTNVLLLNLLIAMFSNTFQQIQEKTDQHWHFQRYNLIFEYCERPFLPPPFIIFSHIFRLLKYFRRGCSHEEKHGFLSDEIGNTVEETRQLDAFEENRRDDFMYKDGLEQRRTTEYQVTTTSKKLDILVSRVDELPLAVSSSTDNGDIEKRISGIESQLEITNRTLERLVRTLTDSVAAEIILKPTAAEEKLTTTHQGKEGEKAAIRDTSVSREVHRICRMSPYPMSRVQRSDVPDDKVPWEIKFRRYSPVRYTARAVLDRPVWADSCDFLSEHPSMWLSYSWNSYDPQYNVDRTSNVARYQVPDGIPLNPRGRTGLCGRGELGRWGPNHAIDSVVTRWRRDHYGEVITDGNKPLLQFVAIKRGENSMWALPGGFETTRKSGDESALVHFSREALGLTREAAIKRQHLLNIFKGGKQVYTGYVDDPRNTDNAWMETRVLHYHDDTGEMVDRLELRAGLTEIASAWLTLSNATPVYASHGQILEKVAKIHNAAF